MPMCKDCKNYIPNDPVMGSVCKKALDRRDPQVYPMVSPNGSACKEFASKSNTTSYRNKTMDGRVK